MNYLSKDINQLRCIFSKKSLWFLQSVFEESNHCTHNTKELDERLLSVLKAERNYDRIFWDWKVSPSGKNHIVVCEELCIFINIYGFYILMSSCLFCEGELCVRDIQWIEKDNLVVVDFLYIVHRKRQKAICHFSNDDDSFLYFCEMKKELD